MKDRIVQCTLHVNDMNFGTKILISVPCNPEANVSDAELIRRASNKLLSALDTAEYEVMRKE